MYTTGNHLVHADERFNTTAAGNKGEWADVFIFFRISLVDPLKEM